MPDPTGASETAAPDAIGPVADAVRFAGLRVDRRIGAGGSGVVYRAWSEARRAHVALKVLRAGRWASEVQRARFRREVEVHRRIVDPGVVLIFEDGTTPDGAPWVTLELIDGPSLQQLVDERRLPPLATRVRWIREVARTLARLHARGVYHRDVKPSNILLLGGTEPRLADFGVALVEDESRMTMGSRAVGTPRFMAPEQVMNEVDDWARVDVYALGLVLAELLGARASTGEGAAPDLAYVVQRASAAAPADRYPTAAALAEDLERWLAGRPVRLRPGAVAWRARRSMRPRTPMWIGLAVGAGLALAVGGAIVAEARRAARADADWAVARARLAEIWAEGDHAGAEAWVSRFAADPARTRTAAAGRAWLELAALRRDAADREGEVEALGRVVAATQDPEVRGAALARLVTSYRFEGRWSALERLVHALPMDGLDLDPALRAAVELDLALAAGDVERAMALRPDLASLLVPFARVREMPEGTMGLVDTDDDGVGEWVYGEWGAQGAPYREGANWRFGAGAEASLTTDARGALVSTREGTWILGPGGATRVGPYVAYAARIGDRVYANHPDSQRVLEEYVPTGPVPAHAATNALTAYVTGIDAGDLDGDGVDELVAGFGPAFGFLLRVYRAGEPDEEPLVPLADTRPGYVGDVTVLPTADGPRVMALLPRANPSAYLFGTAEPFGAPCGVTAWRYDAAPADGGAEASAGGAPAARGRLVADGAYAFPPGPCELYDSRVADLEGDGAPELLVNSAIAGEPALLVFRHRAGVVDRLFALPGYEVAAVAPGRGAPDRVLLATATQGRKRTARWALGEGDDRLPTRRWTAGRADAGNDATLRIFEALSLDAAAAEMSEQRGDLARAASFWERAGDPDRAARALAEAARDDEDPAVLERAIERAVEAAETGVATELIARLEARSPARGAASRELYEAQVVPRWRVDLTRPLPDELQVRFPAALRHDLANGELRLRVPSGGGDVLRLPLRATGARAWLRVAGDWVRAEWGSVLQVRLQRRGTNPGRAPLFLHFTGTGAGGVLFREVYPTGFGRVRVARTDLETSFDLRVGMSADGRSLRSVGTVGDDRGHYEAATGDPPLAGEAWELVVTGPQGVGAAPGPLSELVLRRLEIGGFEAEAAPPAPLPAPISWAAATGPAPGDDPAEDPLFIALLRLDPSLLGRVRATWGDAAANRLFAAAWYSVAHAHRGDATTVDALLGAPALDGVPTIERLGLSVAKGEAYVRTGRVEEARAALLDVWTEASALGIPAWREALDAAALLAELELTVGDEAAATEWARRAAAAAPDADLGERLLRSRPRLAGRTGP